MSSKADEYNKYYHGKPDKGYAPMVERLIVSNMKDYPHKRVLDLGCGVGNNIKWLSGVWKDAEFTGVDLSQVAIDTATIKVPTAFFACDTIEHVKLDGTYDIIFLIGVLEHIFDIYPVLDKVLSLSSGVVFVRTVYNSDRADGVFTRPGFGDNQEEWNLSKNRWEDIFIGNGFKIVKEVTGQGLTEGRDLAWMLEKK
jgi:2-polyprenyl-3-methyl-5-hydroxy-6-metoxy-1,4-benzoquinol methylase